MTDAQSTHGVKARPTVYRGIRMRSRLEANYAARLDGIGLKWDYEPMCFADEAGQYLPDFAITATDGRHFYIEVKPTERLAREWINGPMQRIWSSDPAAVLVATWKVGNEWHRYTLTQSVQWWEWALGLDVDIEYRGDGWISILDEATKPEGHMTRWVVHYVSDDYFDSVYTHVRKSPGMWPAGVSKDNTGVSSRNVDDEWHVVVPQTIHDQLFPSAYTLTDDDLAGTAYSGLPFAMTPAAWLLVELDQGPR